MTLTQRAKRMIGPDRCDHKMVEQTNVAGLRRSICTKCGQITLINMSDEAAAKRARNLSS